MAEMFYLNKNDKDLLQQLLSMGKSLLKNGQHKQNPSDNFYNSFTYIAKTPAGGIPALEQSTDVGTGVPGTGTGPYDRPGFATCNIYKLVTNIGGEFEELVDTGKTERVYNITTSAITDEWIQINKTKFGKWVATTGGGGTAACTAQNAIMDITVIGSPDAGVFILNQTINSVTEALEFSFDDIASEVETEFETHSEVSNGDVSVSAGPFPNKTMRVEFQGNLANTDIQLPTADWSQLGVSSGTGTGTLDITDQTGVAVIVALSQLGIAAS